MRTSCAECVPLSVRFSECSKLTVCQKSLASLVSFRGFDEIGIPAEKVCRAMLRIGVCSYVAELTTLVRLGGPGPGVERVFNTDAHTACSSVLNITLTTLGPAPGYSSILNILDIPGLKHGEQSAQRFLTPLTHPGPGPMDGAHYTHLSTLCSVDARELAPTRRTRGPTYWPALGSRTGKAASGRPWTRCYNRASGPHGLREPLIPHHREDLPERRTVPPFMLPFPSVSPLSVSFDKDRIEHGETG